ALRMPATGGCRVAFVRGKGRDHVLARAVIDLNRAFQVALGDRYLALAHGHARLLALPTALDHGRALRGISSHSVFDGDLEIAGDRFVSSVSRSLRKRDRGDR